MDVHLLCMYVCVFIPACIVMVFVLVSKHVNCCVTLYCRSPLYVCVREVGAVQPKRWRRVIRLYVCLCVLGCGRANMLFIIICSCCYFSCCCYCLCPRWPPSVGVAVAPVLVVVVVDVVVIFIALRYCGFAMFDCCCCCCCLCVFSTNT